MTPGEDAQAIKRFSAFLEHRKCCFWLENELTEVLPSRDKKVDFFVRTRSHLPVLVEIESFKEDRRALKALRQNSVMSGLHQSDSRRVAARVRSAGDQLESYRDRGFPGIVVLDDFRGVGMPVNTDVLGLVLMNYFPASNRPYVSAVGWLLESDHGQYFLRVFHNPHADVPLDRTTFGTEFDEHWYQPSGRFFERST